ncbi:MAG: lipid-A-disaccharide synthase [Bacteroidia bacterium]|nr:lipid-A-disaccharide synthase [Bacteroidia bacterium]
MKLYFIAGEASGDLHGKNLLRALKNQAKSLETRGVGGDGMQAEGMSLIRHIRETNFMGWISVLQNLGKIRRLFRDVKADILAFKPDAVVLIDYPGFNLRMAEFLKKNGIKVIYYISPQVWAWKKGRVKKIKAFVDRMLVILPFEKEFYAREGVEVDFVGHPLLDEIAQREFDDVQFRRELSLDERPVVALLPGSREMEIKLKLPVMVEAAKAFPNLNFVVGAAPTVSGEFYGEILGNSPLKMVRNRTYDLLHLADFAFVTSGTATLETALFGVPEVVCYAGNWLSVQLARRLIQVRFISLVNLIMDRLVVKELIQKDLTPQNLIAELTSMQEDADYLAKMKTDFSELRHKLGESGASKRAAEKILEEVGLSK